MLQANHTRRKKQLANFQRVRAIRSSTLPIPTLYIPWVSRPAITTSMRRRTANTYTASAMRRGAAAPRRSASMCTGLFMCPKTKRARIHWKKKVGHLLRFHCSAVVAQRRIEYSMAAHERFSDREGSRALHAAVILHERGSDNKEGCIRVQEARADAPYL